MKRLLFVGALFISILPVIGCASKPQHTRVGRYQWVGFNKNDLKTFDSVPLAFDNVTGQICVATDAYPKNGMIQIGDGDMQAINRCEDIQ